MGAAILLKPLPPCWSISKDLREDSSDADVSETLWVRLIELILVTLGIC